MTEQAETTPSSPSLTPRQREVLTLVADGYTDNEIARRLILSADTISNHVRRARERLNARSRAQAVAIAIRLHLIQPGLDGEDSL